MEIGEENLKEKEEFVLEVVKILIHMLSACASNMLFHHSLVRPFYTQVCSHQILLLMLIL